MSLPLDTPDLPMYTRHTPPVAGLSARYDVGEEIGHGGSSVVYRARRVCDGLLVAVKVMRPEVAGHVVSERFLREIAIESRIAHPNITPVLESGELNGLPYFVLPLAEEGTLRGLLDRHQELPLEQALSITRDIAGALACAHEQGIIHRDVKPENILLGNGRAYLVDFGIARVLSEVGNARTTESGIALGTPAYMSPEQGASERMLDGRSDLYSLACVLYEMLSGDPPFSGRSSRAIIARHAYETPYALRIIRPLVPASVEYALQRALAKSPADRFATVDEFVRALEAPPPAGWVSPADAAKASVARRRQLLLTALVAVVVSAVTSVFVATRVPAADPYKVMLFPLADASPTDLIANPGWSVALAINQSLEHALPLRGLDGWSYMDAATRIDVRRLSPGAARRIARSRGARYYVMGAIARSGDSTRVTLQLFDAPVDTLVAQESAAGAADEAAVVQSGLHAAALLLPRLLDPGRGIDVAFLANRNKSALALWIQGERAYRQADFVPALDLFQRALAEDSLFAVAALRGAQAASWQSDQDLAARLLSAAVAHDSLLPPGRAALARGFDAYLRGNADSSVYWLDLALRQIPDAADAPMLLGEAYHHLVREGGDDVLAAQQFQEAARRDTAFTPPLVHLAEIAIRVGNLRVADAYIEKLRGVKSDSTLLRQLKLMRDCVHAGRLDWSAAASTSLTAVAQASHELAAAARQPECAEGAFRAVLNAPAPPDAYRWHALVGLQGLLVAEGRGEEAKELLDVELAAGRTKAMLLYAPDAMAGAPTAAKRAEIEAFFRAKYGDDYERASMLGRWMLALSHAQGGDAPMVQQIATSVQRTADSTQQRADRSMAAAVAAHAMLANGDTTGAIARLRSLRPSAPSKKLLTDVFEPLAVERLVLARLLVRRGQLAEAARLAATFDQPQPIMNLLYIAESLRIREEVATKLSQTQVVDEVRARLRALRVAGDRRRS